MNPYVIIADDHPLFRDALRQAISGVIPDCEISMVGDLDGLRKLLGELNSADLVLLDLSMPGASGFSGLISIRAEFPETPVIVVSAAEDTMTIKKCIELGASGFIPKSSGTDYLVEGIRSVQSGEVWVPPSIDLNTDMDPESADIINKLQSLTPQQTRVLSMLGEGLLNKQIAYELDVSEATVKAHVSAVLLKLGVDSRTQAVIIMNKIGSGFMESAVNAD
ncbi:MAG: response regulator transcription factor [Pseudomonadota bacterium]